MSAPALWTKHRPIAKAIAREYRIPGLEAQDIAQEALIALWEASRLFDREKGSFPPFARTVIHRHLTDVLKTATREKRTAVTVPYRDSLDGRSEVPLLPSQLPLFTPAETRAIEAQANGTYDHTDRSMENASQSALRKLRAA